MMSNIPSVRYNVVVNTVGTGGIYIGLKELTMGEIADMRFDNMTIYLVKVKVLVLMMLTMTIIKEDELASERGAVVEETLVVRNHSQATDESEVNIL